MSAALQSPIVIVAKTHLGASSACIGAVSLDGKSSLRLLGETGFSYRYDVGFAVGQTWEISYRPRPTVEPPHVEDVYVQRTHKLGQQTALRDFLLTHLHPWRGGPDALFNAKLRPTSHRHWYCSPKTGLPPCSTGFWQPDQPLTLSRHEGKTYYCYGDGTFSGDADIAYVGYTPPVETIPAGSLLRVSLARPWNADGTTEPRCYLQLSGWYD